MRPGEKEKKRLQAKKKQREEKNDTRGQIRERSGAEKKGIGGKRNRSDPYGPSIKGEGESESSVRKFS